MNLVCSKRKENRFPPTDLMVSLTISFATVFNTFFLRLTLFCMSISLSLGYHLQAHVIRTILVMSPVECGQYCLLEQRCESLNYYHPNTDEYKSACELNNSTTQKNKEHFRGNEKTTYYQFMTEVRLLYAYY